ncbi:MAG: ABC transporter ATP-binding protein [Gemmatimonadota bacterium]|nr:ABC transporter ATP-binding protein [Gemmatimonadota bacterium]
MNSRLWRRILSYLGPHRWMLLLTVVATALVAALDAFSVVLLIPFLSTIFGDETVTAEDPNLVDRALEITVGRFVELDGDPQAVVAGIIVFIVVVVACKSACDFARSYLAARVEQGVTRDLRDRVYGHLLELDLGFFGRMRTGQIVSRLTHDVEQLRTLVTSELIKSLKSVLEFVAFACGMAMISVQLTVASFVVIPMTMVIWGPLVRRLRRGDREVLHMAGEVGAHIQETVAGIRLVKSTASERHEHERFRSLTRGYFDTFLRTVRLRALAAPITELFVAFGTGILLWYGARMVVVEGSLTGEAFIGFIILSARLYAPVKYLSKLPALIQPGLVGAERVFEFLDAPAESRARDGTEVFNGVREGIRYRDVRLEYREGEPVLQGVSFHVSAGSVVALVGPSGAGKTSIVDLLGRFYEPAAGSIEIDGTDVRGFSLASLRAGLGVVSQDTVLFHDTVRSNIAYGMGGVPIERIEEAARTAFAHDFVRQLPDGYDTVVGERGATLSGGQRQRIAIARAILRDPPVLVLDEATSALDTESERLVQEAMGRLLAGRTVFVIAHRLSTIQRADLIVVVDEGRIVQRGSHESLMEEGGLYRRLRELQFR